MSDMEAGKHTDTDNRPAASGRIIIMAHKSHRRRNRLLIIAGAVLLIAGGLAAWYFLAGPGKTNNLAFTIDGQNYTKQQITDLTKYPTSHGLSADDAAKRAYDMYKRQIAAQKTGVVISDDQIAASQKNLFPGLSGALDTNTEAWVKLVSYDNALTTLTVSTPAYSNAEGYVFLFWFSQRIVYNKDRPAPNFGDAAKIAADRQYASDRANYYRQQLANNAMTPDKVVQAIKADSRLAFTYGLNDNQSQQFKGLAYSAQGGSSMLYVPSEAQDRIVKVGGQTGLDAVQVGSIEIGDPTKDPGFVEGDAINTKPTEAFFYLIDTTKAATGSFSTADLTANLNKLASHYWGVK